MRLVLALLVAVGSSAAGQPKQPPALPDMGRSKEDPRLQVRISVDFQRATVQQVLDKLQATTGVELSLNDRINLEAAAFGEFKSHNAPAWQLMQRLTQSNAVRGHWEVWGNGYRLMGTVSYEPSSPPQPATEAPTAKKTQWRWVISAVVLVLIVGVTLVLWLRYRRAACPKEASDAKI